MLENIKEAYNEAMKNQSYPEMKEVAKRLLNYLEITEISETEITYAKHLVYRDTHYEIEVGKSETADEWEWRIYRDDNLINYGSLSCDSHEDVFNSVISDFSKIIEA